MVHSLQNSLGHMASYAFSLFMCQIEPLVTSKSASGHPNFTWYAAGGRKRFKLGELKYDSESQTLTLGNVGVCETTNLLMGGEFERV